MKEAAPDGGYDHIIVGAGSAGCVLAARLSENPPRRVLLLEAGGRNNHPYVHIPAAIVKAIGNPRLDWMHLTEPDPSRGNRVDLWSAGRGLGGSSAINGMLWVRGAPNDYDRWADLGAHGWSAADVWPLFRRIERTALGQDQERGREGAMAVEPLRSRHPLGQAFQDAAVAAGWRANPDYNGRCQEGVGPPQVTQRRGRRFSAARAYLAPARGRPNLTVLTDAHVDRLAIEGRRCIGVHLRGRGLIRARETILSAGAMGSPKLLMLSGIGPAADLAALGIAPVLDSPEVGRNVQEHPHASISHDVTVRTFNQEVNGPRVPVHLLNWLLFRRGPVTSAYPHAVGFFRSDPTLPHPDLQLMFGPFAFAMSPKGVVRYAKPAVTSVIALSYPKSTGRITLTAPRPDAKLRIEHRLLDHPDDAAALVRGLKRVRDVYRQPAIARFVLGERLPGRDIMGDAALEDYVRATSFPTNHPMGGCAIGKVVGPDLRVAGVDGLRVADASVMPTHVSGNINACAIMIGEKASDLIRGREAANPSR